MSYSNEVAFEVLVGQTIKQVRGLENGSEKVVFVMSDETTYYMRHHQNCCEYVAVEDVIGDVSDLNDAIVIDAREEDGETPAGHDEPSDSYTWTFYIIQTNKGAVTIRWLGQSNGYYSERVDFETVNGKRTV